MAVTWAATNEVQGVSSSGKRTKRVTLTPTGTYTTGGDTLGLAAVGLKRVDAMFQVCDVGNQSGLSARLAGTAEAPLIQLYETNETEVGSGASITGRAIPVVLEGF